MGAVIPAAEAAARLGISVRTLDRLGIGEGQLLPIMRTSGGHRRYDADEVEAYRTGQLPRMCDWETGAGHTLENRPGPGRYLLGGARCRLERGHTGPVDDKGHLLHQPNAQPVAAAS